jgi:hypothetical protein
MGEDSKAELAWVRVLGIAEKFYGRNNTELAAPLNALVAIYKKQGKNQQAEETAARASRLTSR